MRERWDGVYTQPMEKSMTCRCGHKAYEHASYTYTDPGGSQLLKENGRQCSVCSCTKCIIEEPAG